MVDCKICEHPYCEHAGTQRGIVVSCDNYMPRQKPQTNADRIRTMNDEELARWLVKFFWGRCEEISPFNIEKWLKQPVKDGEGDGTAL